VPCLRQALLRWGLQQGCAVIPKSITPAYITASAPAALQGWELGPAAMAALGGLEDGHKYCWDPSGIF
jgi:diketogulonate reductase-like aldo/keto reductase